MPQHRTIACLPFWSQWHNIYLKKYPVSDVKQKQKYFPKIQATKQGESKRMGVQTTWGLILYQNAHSQRNQCNNVSVYDFSLYTRLGLLDIYKLRWNTTAPSTSNIIKVICSPIHCVSPNSLHISKFNLPWFSVLFYEQ